MIMFGFMVIFATSLFYLLFMAELVDNSLPVCLADGTSTIGAHISIITWFPFMGAIIPYHYIRTFRRFYGVSDPYC